MHAYASSLDLLNSHMSDGVLTVALRLDGVSDEHDETLSDIFSHPNPQVGVNKQDVRDTFAWAKDTATLYRIAKTVILKLKQHKTGVVSYVLYTCAIKVIAALVYRIAHKTGVQEKDTQLLKYVLVYMKRMMNEFDPEHVANQGLDGRVSEHVNGKFYKTVVKYATAIMSFFKMLWAKLKSFVSGKRSLDTGVANPAKLVPAAITKLASLDGIYKNMGKRIVSVKVDPELPKVRTDFLAVQHAILDASKEPASEPVA